MASKRGADQLSNRSTTKRAQGRVKRPAGAHLAQVRIDSREALRAWLQSNFQSPDSVWLVYQKQSSGGRVRWNDIVEEALCFGWIDSLPRAVDDTRTMLLISPRKLKSQWSAKNKQHIESLRQRGLMHAAGEAAVTRAQANGTYDALDAVSALEIPADLKIEFSRYEAAHRLFEAFPPSVRRGILEWITAAKRPATRAQRIAETARLASDNIRANQWRK
jgi:uncharacterized protein YdeI (YjbR/CyaY-like superfamily)